MAADQSPEELSSWLRLSLIPGIGGETQRKLLRAFGLPCAIFSSSLRALRDVVGEKPAQLLLAAAPQEQIDAALDWAHGDGQHILTLADAAYPQSLLEIPDPPSVLYVRGDLAALNRPSLSMVGSRNPTAQGARNAEQFAFALSRAGLVITSGLALGIDAAAHRGALAAQGSTVAFIGTGIDRIYPAHNRDLALEIGKKGSIVSEFPLGTAAHAANFPRRNRLISGFSRGVLVVEAAVESGSLITARLAGEQGREVFAIPGSIHSPQARGCHRLIRQGAKLVETATDVLEEIRWASVSSTPAVAAETCLAGPQARLLSLIGFDPCSLDTLVERSGLPAEILCADLLHLELAGHIASLPGGNYQRLSGSAL